MCRWLQGECQATACAQESAVAPPLDDTCAACGLTVQAAHARGFGSARGRGCARSRSRLRAAGRLATGQIASLSSRTPCVLATKRTSARASWPFSPVIPTRRIPNNSSGSFAIRPLLATSPPRPHGMVVARSCRVRRLNAPLVVAWPGCPSGPSPSVREPRGETLASATIQAESDLDLVLGARRPTLHVVRRRVLEEAIRTSR